MSASNRKCFCEEDLYKPVYNMLTDLGYTVRSEVSYCDVTAVKDDNLVIVEMKKSLNLDVVLQAAQRQRLTDSVYIAVPKPGKNLHSKRWKNIYYLLKRLELGLMFVSLRGDRSWVEIAFDPASFSMEASKRKSAKKRAELLKEFNSRHGDYNSGGSTGKKLMTAYKEMSIHIACCLEKFGPMSAKELKLLGTDEKKTYSIISKNHYGWFQKVSRAVYEISDYGRQAIREYHELVEYYNDLIENKKQVHFLKKE
jgi:hypothetical protein